MLALMSVERAWFGFAPRTLGGTVIDGRRRIAAAKVLGLSTPPAVECASAIEAARWLALQRHYRRSIDLQEEKLGGPIPLLIPPELSAELEAVRRGDARAIARRRVRANEHGTWQRRRDVVERVNTLLETVLDRGFGATALELRAALGEFERTRKGNHGKATRR